MKPEKVAEESINETPIDVEIEWEQVCICYFRCLTKQVCQPSNTKCGRYEQVFTNNQRFSKIPFETNGCILFS